MFCFAVNWLWLNSKALAVFFLFFTFYFSFLPLDFLNNNKTEERKLGSLAGLAALERLWVGFLWIFYAYLFNSVISTQPGSHYSTSEAAWMYSKHRHELAYVMSETGSVQNGSAVKGLWQFCLFCLIYPSHKAAAGEGLRFFPMKDVCPVHSGIG